MKKILLIVLVLVVSLAVLFACNNVSNEVPPPPGPNAEDPIELPGDNDDDDDDDDDDGELLPQKQAISDFAISVNDELVFTSKQGDTYKLVINNLIMQDDAKPGDVITSYLEEGINEIGVIVSGDSENAQSNLSNTVTITIHETVNDILVQNGEITFTEGYGFTYTLFVNNSEIDEISSGDRLSADWFGDGENTVKLKISSDDITRRCLTEFSAEYNVFKFHKITNVSVDAAFNVTFTLPNQNYATTFTLCLDATEFDNLSYDNTIGGFNILDYVGKNGNIDVKVQPVAGNRAGYIDGDVSTVFDYAAPYQAMFDFEFDKNFIDAESFATHTNIAGLEKTGVKFTTSTSSKTVKYSKPVDLDSNYLYQFATLNYDASLSLQSINVNLIDKDDSNNVIKINYFLNNDAKNAGMTYLTITYNEVDYKPTQALNINLTDSADKQRARSTFAIFGSDKKLTVGGGVASVTANNAYTIDLTSALTGFANGFYVEFEFATVASNTGVIIQSIGNKHFDDLMFSSVTNNTEISRGTLPERLHSTTSAQLNPATSGIIVESAVAGASFEYRDIINIKNLTADDTLITFRGYLTTCTSFKFELIDVDDPTNIITLRIAVAVGTHDNAGNAVMRFYYGGAEPGGNTTFIPTGTYSMPGNTDFSSVLSLGFDFASQQLSIPGTAQKMDLQQGGAFTGFDNGAKLRITFVNATGTTGLQIIDVTNKTL